MTSVLERMVQRARGPLSSLEPLSPLAFGPRPELWTSPGGIETVASEPAPAHRPAPDRRRTAERSSWRPSGDPSRGEDPPIGVHAATVAMAPPEPAVMHDAPTPATTPDIDAPSHSQPPAVRGETGVSGPPSRGDDRHEAPPRAVIEPASRIPAAMPDPEPAADGPAAMTRDGSDRTPGNSAHQTPGDSADQASGDGSGGSEVTISIGHIVVHAAPAIERPRAQPPFRPRVSLEEFLGQTQERRR
jgi:hypothetical protein